MKPRGQKTNMNHNDNHNRKMKKYLLLIVTVLMMAVPSRAVLKEKNLENTLMILKTELVNYHRELDNQN